MSLASGTKLGPYEIQSAIGAGGMGEVYRAKDTRLGRDVAIKILTASFAADTDRLRRFEQEARTIAALNHPNILGIHDIGTHDGTPYLVSEFLDGRTLREELQAAALPIRRTIEYALGIAHGLAAAHDKGVVHRDLKPENIFVTKDGTIKILDFGLAKLQTAAGGDAVATMTSANTNTTPGMVMGTVGYMSPEQVRGEVADQRSDIFSFGAVLFEMLTGKRAFKRDTAAETMTAILREEPPELTETGFQGPLGLQRILARCLEKNVERRFQSASDLGFAIESLSGTSTAQTSVAHGTAQAQTKRSWLPWAAATLCVLLVGTALLAGRWSVGQPPPLKFTRLTYQQGYPSNARFAKDGQTIVYSAQWNDDPMQVLTVRTEFPQSTRIDLPSAALLALSPTGDLQLATDLKHHSGNFLSGTMSQAQMAGGSPRALATEVIAADYSPDGKSLAVARHANSKVQLEFPVGKVVFETSGYVDNVRVSPGGNELAFMEHPVYGDDRGWVSLIDSAGAHRKLTKEFDAEQGLAWAPSGKEIWFTAATDESSNNQQVYGVDLSGKLRDIYIAPQRLRLLDIASDGRVLFSSEQYRTEITGIDPASGRERKGLARFDGASFSDIARDGKAILLFEWGAHAGPLYQVDFRKLDGSAPVVLGPGSNPRFSPDGATASALLFSQPPQIALHPIGPGESRRLSLANVTAASQVAWFPDNKHLLLIGATEGSALRTYEMDIEGGKPQALGPPDWRGGAVSSDGNRIAGFTASGQMAVLNRSTQQIANVPGVGPQEELQAWTKDGEALLLQSSTLTEASVYRVEVATGKRTLLHKVELSDKGGSVANVRLLYAEDSKTYAYQGRRILGSLYVCEGLR